MADRRTSAQPQLLDPRGRLVLERLALATRPDVETLRTGTILFYDNEKMKVGHYGLIFDRIKAGLSERGITRFHDHHAGIRGKTPDDIAAMAREFFTLKASAAVIALADMGVSPAMVALTVEMEKRGIPTVCLTAEPGSQLCVAYAHYRAGALCLISFDICPPSPADTVSAQAEACVPRIVSMLTSNGAALAALARIDYAVDPQSAAADGTLPLAADTELGEAHACFERLHIGDGLPFVPPTPRRFDAMREYCPFDCDDVIVRGIGPSGTPLTVREALIAALMAGCVPEHVPVVLTALRAIARPQYGLLQAVTTSFSGGHYTLASGPIAQEAGLYGGQGCIGPGFRGNASVGRAVNLALLNVGRAVPGHADLACISSPAEYTYCMAESPALSPWPLVHAERFDTKTTCVMMLKAEPPHAVMDLVSTTAEDLMDTIVDCCTTMGSNNAYVAGCLVLVLNPDHAQLLVDGGYDKARLRSEVHARARVAHAQVSKRGIVGVVPTQGEAGYHYVTRSPADVEVVVAGGRGGHSGVILPWALHSDPVYEAVRLPDGRPAESLEQFRTGR